MSSRLRPARALCLLAFAAASPLAGQPAHLVRDIVAGDSGFGGSSSPADLTAFGAKVAFTAVEGSTGREVWISDSESRRTYSLGDICQGYCPDAPEIVGVLGSTLFFLQRRTQYSERLLWASDGTVRGTHPVLDAPPVQHYALLPGRLVFLIGGASGLELWRTDGTAGGTTRVATLAVVGVREAVFLISGNRASLLVWHESTLEVWSTDGSTAGTRQLAALAITPFQGERQAATATHAFFVTTTAAAGQELWASDGTVAGTRAVSSFAAPTPFLTRLKPIGKYVYFLADDITHGHELWRSDGTPKGTTRVTDFGYAFPFEDFDYDYDQVEELNGKIVFIATDGFGPPGLWTSTGSPSSTRRLAGVCDDPCSLDIDPWLRRLGNRLFFPVYSTAYGELWSTDGTTAAVPLRGPCPGNCVSRVSLPRVIGDRLYFLANGSSGRQLWSSDGTATGTYEASRFENPDAFESFSFSFTPELVAAGGRIWFAAAEDPYGQELWSSAGTADTTELAADANPGGGSSDPTSFAALGDRALFLAARCDSGGHDLWVSDGGGATQRLSPFVAECFPGLDPEQPIVTSGGYGFYWRFDSAMTLWRTDGTAAGVIPLATFPGLYSAPSLLPVDGGVAFILGSPGGFGAIWRSNGTVAGTGKLPDLPALPTFWFGDGQSVYFLGASAASRQVWRADLASGAVVPLTAISPDAPLENARPFFTRVGNEVYFRLLPLGRPAALWRTDGTPAGTVAAFDLPSAAGPLASMSNVAGTLYLHTGANFSSTYQLWRVDASFTGATRLGTFVRRAEDPFPPFGLAAVGGTVLFVGDDLAHGRELWSTDGTPEGTRLLRDVLPGAGSSSPSELTALAGRVFFTAGEDVHGREVWQSDGTEAGTRLVHDIAPEALSSEPAHLTVAGSNLFFAADDWLHGREPWVLPLAGSTACVPSDTVLCLGTGRFRVEAVWRDFAGNTGIGHAASLTADTGTFWFFSPSNVEVIVKVLDGRGVNGHQWVFYGALSSVEYTLTVTDTETGAVRRYFNPPGRLASVGDTDAFGPRGAAAARKQARLAREGSPPPRVGERRDATAKALCVASATRLCLAGGRFAVEVDWRDFSGDRGVGAATALTNDTGQFWFFSSSNIELVVKVLDGRAVNGKFWLFYGALSSVEYTLTVTDTETGAVRTYTNPSGRLASVADTAAF